MGTHEQELEASCELISDIISGYLDGKPYPPIGELRADMADGLRLLSAAPELLAALKDAVEQIEASEFPGPTDYLCDIIAKAEGR